MGIRSRVGRGTLFDVNEECDLRIYADLARALIRTARPLYAEEDLGLEHDNAVYTLDASTIDPCLSVLHRMLFGSTRSAVKLHAGAFFIICAKSNTLYQRHSSTPVDKSTGMTCNYLTNNFTISAQTVADLYRYCWQVELLCKYGSSNACESVILWCLRECGNDTDMDCHLRLCTGRHHQEATRSPHRSLQKVTDAVFCAV
jgi:hypothetical protein